MSHDLTTSYPRSVHEKLYGVVQLARTIDKADALAHGNIGEYHYNCPMDQELFTFLGIDHEKFLEAAKNNTVESFAKEHVDKKSHDEIEHWNQEWLMHGPEPGSEGEKYFLSLRDEVAPGRSDITSWADLLDLDEKRSVPQRTAA